MTLTAAAGVIHVAAAVAHIDVSLVLSLAFLVVAAIQLSLVGTARRWPTTTAVVLTFTNLAAVGTWAVSRTVGLPLVGLGTVAIAAPAVGPAHDDGHGHGGTETTDRPEVVQLGPGDFEGDTDLTKSENVDKMKALMTGADQPIVITSDGRILGSPGHGAHDTGLADAVEARRRERASASDAPDDGHPTRTTARPTATDEPARRGDAAHHRRPSPSVSSLEEFPARVLAPAARRGALLTVLHPMVLLAFLGTVRAGLRADPDEIEPRRPACARAMMLAVASQMSAQSLHARMHRVMSMSSSRHASAQALQCAAQSRRAPIASESASTFRSSSCERSIFRMVIGVSLGPIVDARPEGHDMTRNTRTTVG